MKPMTDIVLIRPPYIISEDSLSSHTGVPPLSLAYLASFLEQSKHSVAIIDAVGEALDTYTLITEFEDTKILAQGLTTAEILKRIPERTPYVGISCMFSNEWIYIRELINCIRRERPLTKIILGGEHPTVMFKEVFSDTPEVNIVVCGEGEETLAEILKGGDLHSILGIVYVNSAGVLTKNAPRKRMSKLDLIPWPSWDKIPVENYLSSGRGYGVQHTRSMPMIFSRGCPYSCTFCTNPQVWGTNWYSRSPGDVVLEIKHYIKKYQITHIDFFDPTAIVNKKIIIEFCQELIKENLSISWALPSGTRSEAIDAEVLGLMKKAGAMRVQYAPESGSEKTLVRIKKKVNLDHMCESIKECSRVGIFSRATILFGFPDQTRFEVFESLKFINKLAFIGLNDLSVFPFVPYCGSELYKRLEDDGTIDKLADEYGSKYLYYTLNVYNRTRRIKSHSQFIPQSFMQPLVIGSIMYFYALSFMLRPWRIVESAFRIMTKKPKTGFEQLISSIFKIHVMKKRAICIGPAISEQQINNKMVA